MLLQIDEILGSISIDINPALSELEYLQNTAINTLSKEEAQVILIAIEVGKASISYWFENFDDWEAMLSSLDTRNGAARIQDYWFKWKRLAGADVAGAVGAAVTVAVINAVPGAGQVGYGGAILGGTVGASAGEAVIQIWNHYIGEE